MSCGFLTLSTWCSHSPSSPVSKERERELGEREGERDTLKNVSLLATCLCCCYADITTSIHMDDNAHTAEGMLQLDDFHFGANISHAR